MSDEITRYDMSIEWGSMCGCEVVYVSDGEYVRYADYAALRAQLTTAERERDEARRALDALRPMVDLATKEGEGMLAVGLELMRLNKELAEEREAVASFIAQNRSLRHRAEARREREEWETMVGTQRLVLEGMHRRAERAERVVNMLRVASVLPSPDLLTDGDWADMCDAVRALDAAEGTA